MNNEGVISFDCLLNIFLTYLDEDIYESGPEEVYEKIKSICTDEEIEELKLNEWIWGNEELQDETIEDEEIELHKKVVITWNCLQNNVKSRN